MAVSTKHYPGYTNEAHPELFDIRAMPPQPKVLKPGQLPEKDIRQYFEKGYLLVEKFFTEEELAPVRTTINEIVDSLAQKLFKAGKISNLYEDYGYFERLSKLEDEFPGANILCFKIQTVPQVFKDLWINERLLNLVEQLIGPDIAGNPIWNLRTKTPYNEVTTVPWHQDVSYMDNESYQIFTPTAWIPFLNATEENGCLEFWKLSRYFSVNPWYFQFVEGGHLSGRICEHQCCAGGTFYTMVSEEEMEKTLEIDMATQRKVVPVPYGGLVLFNNLIPHRSLPNLSDKIRWSMDFRWQKPDQPGTLWGLKDPVVFRKSDDPNYKVDWEPFDSINRHVVQRVYTVQEDGEHSTEEVDDDFDTTTQGPWMRKWEITHTNRHTDKFFKEEKLRSSKVI